MSSKNYLMLRSAQRARLEAPAHDAADGRFTASHDNSSSNAFASLRSAVSKPSVNQP
jgi:hypothetical protein